MSARACTLAALALLLGALACGDAPQSGVDARIDALLGEPSYGAVNRAEARLLLETAATDERPLFVVQLLAYREQATDRDGRPSGLSGAAAYARYAELAAPLLDAAGAQRFYAGDVERALLDPDGARWDAVVVVRYPSRARFVELLEHPEHRAAAKFEDAALARALVLLAEPAETQVPAELRRLDLTTLPFPPTPDDPPVNVVHLMRFNEVAQYADGRPTTLSGREAMQLYERHRTTQALPLGVRPGITLVALGELIGDGRVWDEVRINNFPSRAAFAELVSVESLSEAGYEDREAALADTYAVLAAPSVNEVGYLPPLR